MGSAICFHGTEVTCDMVSPEHADAKGFVYRESEIKTDWTDWTIEERDGPYPWVVVEIGVYPDDSVLAGQDRKSFRDSFATLAQAQEAYPQVTTVYREVNTSTAHLPDREMNAWEEQNYWDEKAGVSEA